MNDADLIREFRNGNIDVFSELVAKYSRPLTIMILRIVRDQEEAKDISQTVFLKAYEGLPRFMLASSFKTWLYSIALNAVKDHLRKNRKARMVEADPDQLEDSSESPADRLDAARMSKNLREAMEMLPEKQRLTFQLRIYENLDYKEIARILGGTAGGARGNFFQAVKTLRERLIGWNGDERTGL
ncbi:MAG: sigma-70 family RNA polymerase sigma factor [Desulfomonile tiedjei]|uniref:Sigma-70 family RNA polymerase sigma factor n=1 Tax=Desulfomonile tiedjei TaxID=2358 RepID=A0A9D6V588_9BACT|nr:sigma-70 family RNA polymerase sigma factor [Desulfomonile tiedjei]